MKLPKFNLPNSIHCLVFNRLCTLMVYQNRTVTINQGKEKKLFEANELCLENFERNIAEQYKKAILEIKETTILILSLDDQSNYLSNFIFPPYFLQKIDSHFFGSCFLISSFSIFQFPVSSLGLGVFRYSARLPIRINIKVMSRVKVQFFC